MTKLTGLAVLGVVVLHGSVLAAQAPAQTAPAQSSKVVRVWVNTESGIYHCPSSQHYGKTKEGEYLREDQARDHGYEPAGGRVCGPLPPSTVRVWVNTDSGIYHCPGSRYYGNTKEGEYVTEADAVAAGNRPANNKKCRP